MRYTIIYWSQFWLLSDSSITSFTITQTPGSNFSNCVRSSYLFLMLDCRPAVSWLMVDWSFLLLCNDFMRIALYEKKEVKITFTTRLQDIFFNFYYLWVVFQWRGNFSTLSPLSLSTFSHFHFSLDQGIYLHRIGRGFAEWGESVPYLSTWYQSAKWQSAHFIQSAPLRALSKYFIHPFLCLFKLTFYIFWKSHIRNFNTRQLKSFLARPSKRKHLCLLSLCWPPPTVPHACNPIATKTVYAVD